MDLCTVEELKGTTGRILSVDFGDTRTGLALSDPSRFLASGIGAISPGGIEKTAAAVAAVAVEKGARAVVVGLPRNMDGAKGSAPRVAGSLPGLSPRACRRSRSP